MTTTNSTSPSGDDAANGAMGEREAFEAWWVLEMNVLTMDLHRCEFPLTPYHKQPYACHETQRSWLTWQARAALTAGKAAAEPLSTAEVVQEAARIADSFTCGTCGMDGKAAAQIRRILGDPMGSVTVHHGSAPQPAQPVQAATLSDAAIQTCVFAIADICMTRAQFAWPDAIDECLRHMLATSK